MSNGRRDGVREGGGRKREERKRGRKRASYVRVTYMVEGVMQCIIRRVFDTLTLPLHPPIPGILLVSLVSLFACFFTERVLRFESHVVRL